MLSPAPTQRELQLPHLLCQLPEVSHLVQGQVGEAVEHAARGDEDVAEDDGLEVDKGKAVGRGHKHLAGVDIPGTKLVVLRGWGAGKAGTGWGCGEQGWGTQAGRGVGSWCRQGWPGRPGTAP